MVVPKCADSFYEKKHSLILIFRFLLLFLQNEIATEYRERLLRQWDLFKQGKPIRIIKIKKNEIKRMYRKEGY